MTLFKVYECEERTTAAGKRLKKLTLQDPQKQYPYKMVTVWDDFVTFDDIKAGGTVEGWLRESPSKNINPKSGLPYTDRTLVDVDPGQNAPRSPKTAPQSDGSARVLNHLEFKTDKKLDQILAALDRLLGEMGETPDYEEKIKYPKMDETNDASELDEPSSEDSPF